MIKSTYECTFRNVAVNYLNPFYTLVSFYLKLQKLVGQQFSFKLVYAQLFKVHVKFDICYYIVGCAIS